MEIHQKVAFFSPTLLPCGFFVFLAPSSTRHNHTTNTTPSTQHLQHYTIYIKNNIIKTTSNLHNTINTTLSTLHHPTQHHQVSLEDLGAPPESISSVLLRGRRSTRSISVSFCVAGAALGAPPERSAEYYVPRLLLRGRCSTWRTSVSSCVVGAAPGLQRGLRKSGDDWVPWAPAAFAWQVRHLEDLSLILRAALGLRRGPRKSGDD